MTTAPKPVENVCRPLRADAERNRLRIIEAARRLFADRGLAVSLDEVAEAAGVGVGTVYRRFANRDELVNGVLVEHLKEVSARASAALQHDDDPWPTMVSLTTWLCQQMAEDVGLSEILLAVDHSDPAITSTKEELDGKFREIFRRAQEAGSIRADLAWTDMFPIFQMLSTGAHATEQVAPGSWRRYLNLILGAIENPPARRELGAPPLTDQQMLEMRKVCGHA